MFAKNWYKRLGSIAFQMIAWFPIFYIILCTYRTGNYTLDFTEFTNPVTSIISNICTNTFELTSNTLGYNLLVYGFSWNIFVELLSIIYLALLYFVSMIKSFLIRD